MGKAGGLRSFWNEKALAAGVYLGLVPCCSGRQGTHAYTLGKNAKVKGLACIYRGAAVLYVSTQAPSKDLFWLLIAFFRLRSPAAIPELRMRCLSDGRKGSSLSTASSSTGLGVLPLCCEVPLPKALFG